jgi:glycosyltransferase involved in cell wall biosynthesis
MDVIQADAIRVRREDPDCAPPAALKISAIIPLYNGAPYIEEALRSVLAQTRPADEIIVVDDGSTDAGPELVRRMALAHRIVLLSKPNGGQSSARNFGIAHATGDLIALLDQDDAWYPNHLEELLKPFTTPQYPELGWAYSNLDEVDATGGMVRRFLLRVVPAGHPKRDLYACLSQDMFILPSATLISRKAFDAVGGFDEQLTGYEDDDLFLRIFRAGYDNVYIDQPLSRWRIYGASASFSPRMARSRMVFARKLLAAYPDDPAQGRPYSSTMIAPRFARILGGAHWRAVLARDDALAAQLMADLDFIVRRLPRIRRTAVGAVLPLLRRPGLARALYSTRPTLRVLARLGLI